MFNWAAPLGNSAMPMGKRMMNIITALPSHGLEDRGLLEGV